MTSKATVKHACTVCKQEHRADNLMRHVYTHRNVLSSFMSKERIKYCIDNNMPVMYPTDNEWIMCLICKKSAHTHGRNSIKDFIVGYNSVHSKCKACFETVKELYHTASAAPTNTILDLDVVVPTVGSTEKPTATTAPDAPAVDSKYSVNPKVFEMLKATIEDDEDEEMDINDMIECLLARLNIRQKRINSLEKQLSKEKAPPCDSTELTKSENP